MSAIFIDLFVYMYRNSRKWCSLEDVQTLGFQNIHLMVFDFCGWLAGCLVGCLVGSAYMMLPFVVIVLIKQGVAR